MISLNPHPAGKDVFPWAGDFIYKINTNQRNSYSSSNGSPCSPQMFFRATKSSNMPTLTSSLIFFRTASCRRWVSISSWTKEKSKLGHDRCCYSGNLLNFGWYSPEQVFQPFIKYTKWHKYDPSHITQWYIIVFRYGAFSGRHERWPDYFSYFSSARCTGIQGQAIRSV